MDKTKITNKEKYFYDKKIYDLLTRFEIAVEQGEVFEASIVLHSLKQNYGLRLAEAVIEKSETTSTTISQ